MAVLAFSNQTYNPELILRLFSLGLTILAIALVAFLFTIYLFSSRFTVSLTTILDFASFLGYSFVSISLGCLFCIISRTVGYVAWIVLFIPYAYWLVCLFPSSSYFIFFHYILLVFLLLSLFSSPLPPFIFIPNTVPLCLG